MQCLKPNSDISMIMNAKNILCLDVLDRILLWSRERTFLRQSKF